MKKILLSTLMLTLIFFTGCANGSEPAQVENISAEAVNALNIKIIVDGKTFDAVLEDNPSSRTFLEKLPLEVTMTELNGNEKYYRFNEKFPSNDERVGTIHVGDLMLYSSSYVVLFYKNFSTSYSYTRLGHVKNLDELDKILGSGNVSVKFER